MEIFQGLDSIFEDTHLPEHQLVQIIENENIFSM